MKLSGEQRKKLQSALLDAFLNKSSFQQMLSFELDKKLDAIAEEGSLQNIVFNIIQIAEAEGWIENLVRAARKSNNGNSSLKIIAEELLSPTVSALNQSKLSYSPISEIPINDNKTSQPVKVLIPKSSPWKALLGMTSVLIALGIIFYMFRSSVSNYLVYENPNWGIKIKYPDNGWEKAERNGFSGEMLELELFPTTQNRLSYCRLDVFISVNDFPEEKIFSVDEYKNLVLKRIKEINPKSEIIDNSGSATTLSNFKAYKLIYTRQDGKCNLRVMEIGTVRDGKAYFIIYTAEEKQFSELLPTVEKMITSFQISKSALKNQPM